MKAYTIKSSDLHNQIKSPIVIPQTSISDKAHFVLLAREVRCRTPRNWQAHLASEGCFGLFNFIRFFSQRFFQLHCLGLQTFNLYFEAMLHFGIFSCKKMINQILKLLSEKVMQRYELLIVKEFCKHLGQIRGSVSEI